MNSETERKTDTVEPGIVKFKDGRKKAYRARYRDNERNEFRKDFERLGDARRWRNEKTSALVRGDYIDPRRGRECFYDFALTWAPAQDWKDTTREGFPRILKRLDRVLGKRVRLVDVDQIAIKAARIELGKTYAPRTVDQTMKYLGSIMRAAYHTGRVPRDPTIGANSRRRRSGDDENVGPDDVPTRGEILAIWAGAPAAYRAAIALGVSGLRVGEVLGLTADRIDVEAGLVTIDRQLQRIGNEMRFTTPKMEKDRTIRVPSAVLLELRRHLRSIGDDEILFQGRRGTANMRRDQFYASAWRPALVGAGLPKDRYKFHSLRHFCASSMLAEGVNPMAVAGHLGDSLETLQRVYAHWLRDDLDVPAQALDGILRVEEHDLGRVIEQAT